MKSILKKALQCSLLAMLIFPQISEAGALRIERFNTPVKILDKVSQPISLSVVADGDWRLYVEALDGQIRNIDNPNYTLPINRLEIGDMSGVPISHIEQGQRYEVKRGTPLESNNFNLALNVALNGSDLPGNYAADVKFTLVDRNSVVTEELYTLRFTQDTVTTIDFAQNVVNLNLEKDKILSKNASQSLTTPVGLYVSSNKDWKLYIRRPNNIGDKTYKYFVKVLPNGDDTINFNNTCEYIPVLDNQVLLATGKATVNAAMGMLEKKLINVDYMIKGPEDKFIPAGSKSEEFEYKLETEN